MSQPETSPQHIQFIEGGYLHLVNPAGRKTAETVRAKVLEMTSGQDRVAVKASEIVSQPDLMDGFLSETLLGTLRDIFQERFVFMPAITIRKNWYEDWHIDAAFRGDLGGAEARPDFVQCALYWQANVPGQGGGLSVIPGTHLRVSQDGRYLLDANFFNFSAFVEDVENAAGDYVVWDGRLVHRSTAPGPDAPVRLAMFMTVARASANYRRFIAHLDRRATDERQVGRVAEADRFRDATSLSLTDKIPAETVARMSRHGAMFAEHFVADSA
jgi:hypothetical protein